ncbi:hypothetical protein [Chlorogloea sp. CCALA 695]|uniref:hypothetical protein n=1 Tax=Chlorogloea sp. CCALA 695 TaxID=2107693 RepID=UPI000D04F321|nr:hypothetical protein [Chlorogloea sp. CCALA 695]PSB28583.1 hypothetical protein C7B70_20625 [Chlorogloea sp. CCALA 695]
MCAHDSHLVCAVHPNGQNRDSCPDFQQNPDLEIRKFVDFLGLLQQVESDHNCNEPFSNPFALNPDEGQWEPEGASYYNGELILQREQRAREEQLWLLDNHPLFTSVCPACRYHFTPANLYVVHFDCPSCGWIDDSV